MPRALIDLSHSIQHGTVYYKGLPAPVICDYLSRVDVPAICVRAALPEGARAIDAAFLGATCAQTSVARHAVLIHTGWDRHWGTDQYFEGHPYLTEDAAV